MQALIKESTSQMSKISELQVHAPIPRTATGVQKNLDNQLQPGIGGRNGNNSVALLFHQLARCLSRKGHPLGMRYIRVHHIDTTILPNSYQMTIHKTARVSWIVRTAQTLYLETRGLKGRRSLSEAPRCQRKCQYPLRSKMPTLPNLYSKRSATMITTISTLILLRCPISTPYHQTSVEQTKTTYQRTIASNRSFLHIRGKTTRLHCHHRTSHSQTNIQHSPCLIPPSQSQSKLYKNSRSIFLLALLPKGHPHMRIQHDLILTQMVLTILSISNTPTNTAMDSSLSASIRSPSSMSNTTQHQQTAKTTLRRTL